jgi:hypothetical protein
MAVYRDSDQLTTLIKTLFNTIGEDPATLRSVTDANLIIRFVLKQPEASVTINGRKNPVMVTFDHSQLRPDLQVEMGADDFHGIMMGTLPLGKAFTGGKMKVKGPMHKSFVLQDIFHRCQDIYPQLARESGIG